MVYDHTQVRLFHWLSTESSQNDEPRKWKQVLGLFPNSGTLYSFRMLESGEFRK